MLPFCTGLIKASRSCIKKVSGAVKANGQWEEVEMAEQLDDLGEIAQRISPTADDMIMCLYPPIRQDDVRTNVSTDPEEQGIKLTCWRSTNWANRPYIGGLPILFGGASQKSWNHILPFSQGSRPSYDTTWEQAVSGCTIKGNWLGALHDLFFKRLPLTLLLIDKNIECWFFKQLGIEFYDELNIEGI